MFTEDLSAFMDTASGFAVSGTLNGSAVDFILDAPGLEVLGGEVATTEPSALLQASAAVSSVGQTLVLGGGALPAYLAHLAGTYKVRESMPEPPDGAFVRLHLVKN